MPNNPLQSGLWTMVDNGVAKLLNLNFDNQWNIINSNIQDSNGQNPHPISGSFDPATGQIKFVENIAVGPWPVAPFAFPSYVGYYPSSPGALEFAGTSSEVILIHTGPFPGGSVQWVTVQHGWAAFIIQ